MTTDLPAASVAGLSIAELKGSPNTAVDSLEIVAEGVAGDRHAGPGPRQLSLMGADTVRQIAQTEKRVFAAGHSNENLVIEGLESMALLPLDRLRVDGALLELTQLGVHWAEGAAKICADQAQCAMSGHGVFARVIQTGQVHVGAAVTHLPRELRAQVITLSDRASRGEYKDEGGPRVVEYLENFAKAHRWQLVLETRLLPDDRDLLEEALCRARYDGAGVVFTTGGTGVGTRDITPDVVIAVADRLIPGIMEHIRIKYGKDMPSARLSRSVAAIAGATLFYTLPGSVRGVEEYMQEILVTLEHLLLLIRDVSPH